LTVAGGTLRVDVLRGERLESRHDVRFACAAGGEAEGGEPPGGEDPGPVFLRSSAKPFQAAAVVASGAADRFALGDEEIAIVASSHAGEERHTAVVAGLLAKLGLDAAALRCGVHPPFDADAAARVGAAATPLHHNCSGKHARPISIPTAPCNRRCAARSPPPAA
jgi:L-asparaginase II